MGKYEAVPIRGAAHELVFDALNRGVRTWWAVIGAGFLAAAGELGVRLLLTGDVLTGEFWVALMRGLLVALLAGTFSYLARFKTPPPPELTAAPRPAPSVVNVYPLPGVEGISVTEAIRAAQKTDPPANGTVL